MGKQKTFRAGLSGVLHKKVKWSCSDVHRIYFCKENKNFKTSLYKQLIKYKHHFRSFHTTFLQEHGGTVMVVITS